MTMSRFPRQLATRSALLLAAGLATSVASAASLRVTLSHDLDSARPSETVTIPWKDVNAALPGALIQRIAVKDASGKAVPFQVTNVAPQAKDPHNVGAAYGELIFQHSFKAGEKSATYTVEKSESTAPVFPQQTSARYIQERLDDFGWENDKLAHRTYGPALMAPAPAGSGKEVLQTSGLDLWFKRVPYPIVDRWYNKGHDHYHKDEGEGMDFYNVGKSRGAGGTLLQWIEQRSKGAFGTAVILPAAQDFTDDALNNLVLAQVKSGEPLRYYAGGAWSGAGEIRSAAQWQGYVADFARRAAHAVKVSLQAQP
jgi:hypothetical protein